MDTEYEIKVLEINVDQITKQLLGAGFTQQPTQPFRRFVYTVGSSGDWVRLRTDGSKSTLTYKSFGHNSIDGVKELEIVVSDFEKTHQLLGLLGYKAKTYQENRRTNFVLGDVEISIDEWPKIPAYLEIEAKNKQSVEKWLNQLGLNQENTTSEPTSAVYQKYGLDLDSFESLSF